jgi:hypothetical protein
MARMSVPREKQTLELWKSGHSRRVAVSGGGANTRGTSNQDEKDARRPRNRRVDVWPVAYIYRLGRRNAQATQCLQQPGGIWLEAVDLWVVRRDNGVKIGRNPHSFELRRGGIVREDTKSSALPSRGIEERPDPGRDESSEKWQRLLVHPPRDGTFSDLLAAAGALAREPKLGVGEAALNRSASEDLLGPAVRSQNP